MGGKNPIYRAPCCQFFQHFLYCHLRPGNYGPSVRIEGNKRIGHTCVFFRVCGEYTVSLPLCIGFACRPDTLQARLQHRGLFRGTAGFSRVW